MQSKYLSAIPAHLWIDCLLPVLGIVDKKHLLIPHALSNSTDSTPSAQVDVLVLVGFCLFSCFVCFVGFVLFDVISRGRSLTLVLI